MPSADPDLPLPPPEKCNQIGYTFPTPPGTPASASTLPPGPVFRADSVSLQRGDRLVLDQVSCTAHPGRVLAVLGPNGAGKSTLLRLLTGELSPASGTVAFAGRPLPAWPVARLALRRAVVSQHSELAFPFTALEVVRLGRTPHPGRGDTPADLALCHAALAAVDLADRAHQPYPTLSGGERQRVHLARALAQLGLPVSPPSSGLRSPPSALAPALPSALLLDEPTASLDLAHQHSVLALARDLARRENLAVVVVLHDLNLALAYADDALVLRSARVVATGPAPAVLTPALVQDVFALRSTLHPATPESPAHLAFSPV